MAVVNYAPALQGLVPAAGWQIPQVWDMPVPKPAGLNTKLLPIEELRRARDQATAPEHMQAARQLDHFYEALLKGGTVRVMHFGDSPTTADMITADVRALLQKQFGDAGHGFVLIARPWAWYNHRGVEMQSWDWEIDIGGVAEHKDGLFGPGAVRFRGSAGAAASWTFPGSHHTSVEIAYLTDPAGGTFQFEANGDVIGTGHTQADHAYPAYVTFAIPPGATEFSLRVTSGTVQLYGAEFRKDQPGVIYSSLGVNGAGITLISKVLDGAHLASQLRHYKPDLVVLAYGTNESGYPEYVESSWGSELRTAIRRVRAALPRSSILLMSPMDRGEIGPDGAIHTVPALPRLVDIEARISEEEGVAFFNTFEAMGGRDTMARWYASEPRLVGADLIHPLPGGAKIIGELLYSALRDGYNEYKLRKSAAAVAPPMSGKP